MRQLSRLGLSSFLALLLFAASEDSLSKKDLPSAILYLENARKIDPGNYVNSYDLALAYFEAGRMRESRNLIEALMKQLQPGPSIQNRGRREADIPHREAELHNLLADVEESERHPNEAAQQYELAARLDPSEKNVFDLGSDLLKHRAFAPALKVFQFGVRRYPESPKLRVGHGIAYYSLGQYDNAVQALCKAVDLDPTDTKALDFLGKMIDISPRYADDVTKRLARFASIYPSNSAANYYYALSLRKRDVNTDDKAGQQGAEVYLVKAVRLRPDFPDAHYQLGLLYEDEVRDNDAIHQYELAATDQPTFMKAHYHLARLYQKGGHEALAKKEFQILKTLKGNP
ncbi:MAG: tetratricopeptide repeat protein [Acidobacteriota bacterium]|nr:tetratricopeptide repeat protein [Acidobacteriota bacterium]